MSNAVQASINRNNHKLTADKIIQLLDEIHNSPLSDKRWVWELMQNAKDVPNKFGRVSVLIELYEDKLVFSHNGDYFSHNDLTCIIQQVSSKDSANEGKHKQTGKFGTGFIATHLLSNIVDVSGIVKNPATGDYHDFVLRLDRSARKSEDMIPVIEDKLNWVMGLDTGNCADFPLAADYENRSESDFKTSFTYHLNVDTLKKAIVGLSDLINTLPITLVSLPELKSVRVVNHVENTEQVYTCNSETIHSSDNVKIVRSVIDINGEKKHFLTYNTFESEEPLVALSIETQWDGNSYSFIKREKIQPVLFRDFPLIGSEEFHFPFMLNGFNFEPTETRSGILLNSNEPKPQKNRGIIESAVDAAIDFNEWLIKNNAKNTYLLAASREPKPQETWDETYAKPWVVNLQKTWRKRLLSQNLLETKDGYALLSEIRIPDYGTKEANRQFFYFLDGFITEGKLPFAEQQDEWSDVICSNYSSWNSTLKYTKQDFFEDLQRIGNVNSLCLRLQKTEEECYAWLNKLYKFVVSQKDTSFLELYPVIPNQFGNFCLLNDMCTDSAGRIPDKLKDICVGLLGKDLRDELMSETVDDSVFTSKKEYSLENLIKDININIGGKVDNANFTSSLEWNGVSNAVYSLLSLKTNGTEEDNNKRDFVYKFISHFVDKLGSQTVINNLPSDLWKQAERFVVKFTPNLIVATSTTLSSLGTSLLKYPFIHSDAQCIDWLNAYGAFAASLSMSIPADKKIYPNQKGDLETLAVLHYDNSISDHLKDLNFTATGADWRKELLDNRIIGFAQHQPLSTKDIYDCIKKKFDSSETSEDHKLKISNEAIVLIPDTKKEDNSDNMSFYKLAKTINTSLKDIVVVKETDGFYWEKFIACVLKDICSKIQGSETLTALSILLAKTVEDTVSYVDSVIEYAKNRFSGNCFKYVQDDYAVWLNQSGAFCMYSDIYKDDNIDDTIKDLCVNEIINVNYRDKLLRKGMKCEYHIAETRVITSESILTSVNEVITKYVDQDRKSLQDKSFAEIVFKLDSLIKQKEEYKSCLPYFNVHRDRLIVGSIGDENTLSIIGSLVSSPEKMNFLGNLTDDQLQIIISYRAELSGLAGRVQSLEQQNSDLLSKNEELQRKLDALKTSLVKEFTQTGEIIEETEPDTPPVVIDFETLEGTVTGYNVNESQYGGLSEEEVISFLQQAKTDVALHLESLGYQIDWEYAGKSTYSQLFGVKDSDGDDIPVVVHSYRSTDRDFDLNWYDWQFLNSSGKSMLWIVPYSGGPQCVPLCSLPMKTVTIPIESQSLSAQSKLIALATVAETYSFVRFDFGTQIPRDQKTPVPFRFLPEEMKLGVESIAEICNTSIPTIRKELPYMGYRSAIGYRRSAKQTIEPQNESCSVEDICAPRQDFSGQLISDNPEELL